jgi:ACS family sodium-dependent inorganic phosphate cotransporter
LGTVVTLPLSGLLADAFGWEYVYYFFGGAALLFSLIWAFLAHDSPSKHPRISEVK